MNFNGLITPVSVKEEEGGLRTFRVHGTIVETSRRDFDFEVEAEDEAQARELCMDEWWDHADDPYDEDVADYDINVEDLTPEEDE